MAAEIASNHVLRITRSDTESQNDFVIVNTIPCGKDSEDVILEGTEGETPYYAKFSATQLSSARDPKCPLSPSEWTATLYHILLPSINSSPALPSQSSRPSTPCPPAVSLTASTSSSSLMLTLRHSHPGGITQRLGSLSLPAKLDHEIDFLDWTSTAILHAGQLAKEGDAARTKAEEYEKAVQKLAEGMRELVKEKEESERRLLGAAVELLNQKKAKVRGLTRAKGVTGGSVIKREGLKAEVKDEGKAMAGTNWKGKDKGRSIGNSRKGKRKASDESDDLPDEIAESDSESGFEFGGRRTPERFEDEETEDEAEESPVEPRRKLGTIGGGKAASTKGKEDRVKKQPVGEVQSPTEMQHQTRMRTKAPKSPDAAQLSTAKGNGESRASQRELPFATNKASNPSLANVKDVQMDDTGGVGGGTLEDDEETESDDEL